jgi:NitT/TauT family transport system substrate-binding protein
LEKAACVADARTGEDRMLRTFAVVAAFCAALAIPHAARAEATALRVAKQFGVAYMQFMVMEDQKMIEKHAKAAGLGDITVEFNQFRSSDVMNDALISGSVDFVSLGMPAVKVSMQAIMLQMAAAKEFGPAKFDALDHLTVSMAHPDATAAMLGGPSEIVANFSSAPFQYRQMKNPAIRRILTSTDLFDEPLSFNVIATTAKFRRDNPKLHAAFLAALKEATDFINADKKRAAEIYLKITKERTPVEEIMEVLADPAIQYTTKVGGIQAFVSFMARVGTLKNPPADWREMFFPEALGTGG